MASEIAAWGALFDQQGRVLLVKRDYGKRNWILPGGTVESGESPMEAARREVQEETGLIVEVRHLCGIYYNAERDLLHVVFLCSQEGGELTPRPGEIADCGYFEVTNPPRPISNFVCQCIEDAALKNPSAFFRVNPPVGMLE